MGVFSWMTSDTEEQILIGDECKVYMVTPTGEEYVENCYDGRGIFGGKDAYSLLAEMNGYPIGDMSVDEHRGIGIDLEHGDFVMNLETGKMYSMGDGRTYFPWIESLTGFYSDGIEQFGGLSMNELIAKGSFVYVPKKYIIKNGRRYYPLKFSFYSGCKYEHLEAAKVDPDQGCMSYD